MRNVVRHSVVVLALAVLGAGLACGGAETPESASNRSTGGGGRLEHIDGRAALSGDSVVVTPASGDALPMRLGPEVAPAEIQAFARTKQRVRVYYRPGDENVAVQVEKAATSPKAAQQATGLVTEVTETTLTLAVSGNDEPLLLTIKPEHSKNFDVAHLAEHRDEHEQITVYYKTENGTGYALSYQDA